MARKAARGFTLIELLVVLGIIALLGSLAFPAIQSTREASRITACRHHLSQLAKGLIQHETLHQHFPSGGWGSPWLGVAERPSDSAQPGSWVFSVLPFIEEKKLRDQVIGVTSASAPAAYTALATTPVPLFSCPSRRSGKILYIPTAFRDMKGTGDVQVSLSTATRSDYAINSGAAGPCVPLGTFKGSLRALAVAANNAKKVTVCHNGRTQSIALPALDATGHANDTLGACESCSKPFDSTNMRVFATLTSGTQSGDQWRKLSPKDKILADPKDMGIPDAQDGLAFRMSRVQAGSVVDGMSNTYLLGEKYVSAGTYDVGSDDGDARPMMIGYSQDTVRWGVDPPRPDTRRDSRPMIFGSAHRSGWNAAFADGMVRTIDFDIDASLHRQLSNRDGTSRGEMAGIPPKD